MAFQRIKLTLLLIVPLLAACSVAADRRTPTATSRLLPYLTATSTQQITGTTQVLPSPPPIGPTPTPLIHIVLEGETLLGIASRYGISLEDLLIVNPGIDPRLLSVGAELIIPGAEGEPVEHLLPTPTPMPLNLGAVRCYRTPLQGLWCLTLASNTTPYAVEGLVVLVTLLDDDGQPIEMQPTYGPLNFLPPGGTMPLAAFFENSPPAQVSAVATLFSAVQSDAVGSRYIDLEITQNASEPGADYQSWRVQGMVALSEEIMGSGAGVSLLLLAIDVDGDVVGYSKWEAEIPAEPHASVDFDIVVISLGPMIQSVELLSEAQVLP